MPPRLLGFVHLNIAVRDVGRAVDFYVAAFGMELLKRTEKSAVLRTPGTHENFAVFEDAELAGKEGGVDHFGFRLARPEDIDDAVAAVLAAGGTLTRRGDVDGRPWAYVKDVDGYDVELWFE